MEDRIKYMKRIKIILVLVLALLLYSCYTTNFIQINDPAENLLILVNKENKIPDDFGINLISIKDIYVAEVLLNDLIEMQNAALEENIRIMINSAWRNSDKQEQIFNNTVADFVNDGNSQDVALEKAKKISALPGYSEHETGLAIDFTNGGSYEDKLEMWDWLSKNAHKYGFILRYPQGKEDITGYDYEAWHYRYVGKHNAEIMFENDLCLEEYLYTLNK